MDFFFHTVGLEVENSGSSKAEEVLQNLFIILFCYYNYFIIYLFILILENKWKKSQEEKKKDLKLTYFRVFRFLLLNLFKIRVGKYL